jgi:hypothetical protein
MNTGSKKRRSRRNWSTRCNRLTGETGTKGDKEIKD